MSSIPQLFRKLSLRTKLYVCLFAFIIAPLLTTTLVVNTEVVTTVNRQTRETVFQSMQQMQQSVMSVIQETQALSVALLSDENLQALGITYAQPTINLGSEQNQSIENNNYNLFLTTQSLLAEKPYIDSVCFSKDGRVIYQYGEGVTQEDTTYDKEAAALKGVGFWTPIYRLKNTYDPAQKIAVVSFIREVNSLDAPRQLGVVRISINASAISEQYQETPPWNDASLFIVDQTGHVLSDAQGELLGTYVGDQPYIARAFSQSDGFFASSLNNTHVTVFHAALEGTSWQMIQVVPDHDLDTQLVITNFFSSIAIFLCLLFGLLFTVVQNKTIITPLKQLEREMKKMTWGNFAIQLHSHSEDEIGTLGLVFTDMASRLEQYIEREYKAQLKQREAEFKALQAQINPHFLYNTLDSLRWTALAHGDSLLCEQIEALSDLFRHTLNKGNEITTVGEEIDHLRNYLLIQQSRFGEKLTVVFDIDQTLLSYNMLKLLLQPLVENAVYHGIEQKRGNSIIHVKVEQVGETLHATISDDGVGVDEQTIKNKLADEQERESVFALKNIHERIQLFYGKEYGLTFHSQKGVGTTIEIRIPVQRSASEGGDV